MRVVITGAAGLVGRAITRALSLGRGWPEGPGEGPTVTALTHSDLDITNRNAVSKTIRELRPDLVVNCAVIGVDECELNPALARAVNVDGPANLAEHAPAVVHFSSNYVFSGTEEKFYSIDDDPQPINEYGRTKLAGERAVMRLCKKSYIVRSSWIFGEGKDSFISTVHRRLRAGQRVRAVSDVWASTTFIDDLVRRVAEIVDSNAYGMHHVVNAGVCSNESFAREAARIVGADEKLIEADSTHRIHRAPRPRYTPLLALPPLRDWREALRSYIESA